MMEVLAHIGSHALAKLAAILQTVGGWFALGVLFVVDYFAGHSFVVLLVVAVTLMDAGWGIAVSVKQGKFTLSELARLTIAKLAVYGCALFVFVGLDKIVDNTVSASIVGAAIVLVEFWSSCASMLILYPNFLFLRLLKKALTGEIASKLHIEESDVEKVLDGEGCDKITTKGTEQGHKKEEGQ
jgi:hypothetical protein